MADLHDELKQLYYELGITEVEFCSKEETEQLRRMQKKKEPLPEDVHVTTDQRFYRYKEPDMTKEEIKELLLCKQTRYLKSIKSGVIFFVALAIIGLLLGIISGALSIR